VAGEPARHPGAGASGLGQLGELRRAHLDDCELGRDEEAVRQNEQKS
jgi:hypothetical protein